MSDLEESDLLTVDLSGSSRPKTFSADEMVTCEDCLRANPPTRANCLYCGAPLAVTATVQTSEEDVSQPSVPAATGFYVVLQAGQLNESSSEKLAARLETKSTDFLTAINGGATLPLLHFNGSGESQAFVDELRALGIEATVVRADELQAGTNPKKIRALEFSDSGLTGITISSGERLTEAWGGLSLIVIGRLQMSNVEDVVRRKRGGQKPLEHRELMNDETICDLCGRSTPENWRIVAGSFDFSCLGAQKAMTTFENFRILINLLRERAPNVVIDDSYLSARGLLANLWPLGTNTRTGGWRRSGAGKVDMSTVTTTDNETQFSNYARMLRVLKMRELEGE